MNGIYQCWALVLDEAIGWAKSGGYRYKVYGVLKPWGWVYYMRRTDEIVIFGRNR